jgi:hypothetical protein
VSVRPAGGHPLGDAQLRVVRQVAGIGAVDARMEAPLALLGQDGRVLTNFGTAGAIAGD